MCDCDRPDIYEENIHTARKQHVCCECKSVINPGFKYVKIDVYSEGSFQHFKQCLDCNQIGDRYVQETDCCYKLEYLYDELIDSNFLKRDTCGTSDSDRLTKQWISTVDWIRVASSNPLKLVFVEAQETA